MKNIAVFELSWLAVLCILWRNNPEQEEAQEEVTVAYSGESLEIGFNVSYLLDVLNVLKSSEIRFTLADSNSSALVEDASGESKATYVVMPMRL
jgi:DNA polymerase-3 subunit beta